MAKKTTTTLDDSLPKLPFGSNEWVASELQRKFEGTPENPGEALSGITDYLNLQKLEGMLWKPAVRMTDFIWVDPGDYVQ